MEVFALAGAPRPLQTLGVNSTWPHSVRLIRLYQIVFQIQGRRYRGEPTLSFLPIFFPKPTTFEQKEYSFPQ